MPDRMKDRSHLWNAYCAVAQAASLPIVAAMFSNSGSVICREPERARAFEDRDYTFFDVGAARLRAWPSLLHVVRAKAGEPLARRGMFRLSVGHALSIRA
jgi:hypothetical protein